ncbi:MAG: peptide ABC transporter permease [Bdellovibrionaceae bacterium]|nr:peptide ABC transporter permease [Pseudobdellovibrionaceae bacterium]
MKPESSSVGKSLWAEAFDRMKKQRLTVLSFLIVILYSFMALGSYFELIASPWDVSLGESYGKPSFDQISSIFGFDIFGRSVLYKAIHGAQVAMTIGLISSLLSVFIGTFLGAIAGYFGGWIDDLIVWLYTTFASIPYIMLLIAVAFVLEKGIFSICVAIAATSWVGLCRMVRAEFVKHKEREYVLAARSIGASHAARMFKHILPNVFHQVIINFSIQFQSAIKSEVILSYLGLGVQDMPSWGIMIDDSKLELARGVWWQLSAATLFMMFLVLAFNLLGDSLRDSLDPKLRSN